MISIDISYIIAILILRKGVTTKDEVKVIANRLLMMNPNYEITSNLDYTLEYYRDFFETKESGAIISANNSIAYLNMLFADTIMPEVYADLNKVINSNDKKR